MYELSHELPNDLRPFPKDLRKLRNFIKIPKMLVFDGKYPAIQPKTLMFFGKKIATHQL